MNIILLLPSLVIGGGEVFVTRLANSLSEKHRIFIMDLEFKKRDPLLLARISPKVNIVSGEQSLPGKQFFWKVIFKLSSKLPSVNSRIYHLYQQKRAKLFAIFMEKFVTENNINVINSHMAYADWHAYYYFKEKVRTEKFIISMHGCYNRSDTHGLYHVRKRYQESKKAFSIANNIVILTPKNELPLKGIKLKADPVYIPLGFNNPEIKQNSKNPYTGTTFGLVSRAIPRKGWEEAIDSVIALNNEGVSCRLILIGGSRYQQDLECKYNDISFIQFTGSVGNVFEWISQFDIGLFPSYIESESFPNVIAEYLSCGVPVIATEIGEVKNMLTTPAGELAGDLLYYTEGSISTSQLFSLMKRYCQDLKYLQNKQIKASDAFRKFNLSHCIEAYDKLYS